jgi:beta-phosphoglucomutase
MSLKGAIFDLDGVMVETVPLHFKAWKKLFNQYGKSFSFEDYKAKVDGIPRLDGAKAILDNLSDKELKEAAAKKQEYFLEYLSSDGVKRYESTLDLIKEFRSHQVKIAIISSSKNCSYVLDRAGLYQFIDAEVNGNDINKGKPDPEIFLRALDKLGLKKEECIVFEDAVLGVEAAKRALIFTVGIDRYNNPSRLKKADLVVADLREVNYEGLFRKLSL